MTTFEYRMNRAPVNRCRTNFVSPWLHSESLSGRVQNAVAEADWDRIGPMGLPFPKSDRNATFLGILSYCYALGIYPTRDIIQKLVSEKGGPALALIGINAATLRRFRRVFRPLLAQCLTAVLQASGEPNADSDRWPTEEHYGAEAERRIELAFDWDGETLDRMAA